MEMKKLMFAAVCTAGLVGSWSTQVHAIQAVSGATNIDAYNIDIGAGGDGTETLWGSPPGTSTFGSAVDAIGFLGWSVSDFGTDDPSVIGSTFEDYIVLTTDVLTDNLTNNVGDTSYSTTQQVYQITIEIRATGTITENNTGAFRFDTLDSFAMYVDSANDVDNLSLAIFGDTDFSKFLDGQQVLSGGDLTNLGIQQGGQLEPTVSETGKFQLAFEIFESATYDDFLCVASTDCTGGNSLFDVWDQVFFLPDGDLTLVDLDNAQTLPITSQFVTQYGITIGQNTTVGTVSIDGRADVAARLVPEPGTLMLFGLGLLGLASRSIKRKA